MSFLSRLFGRSDPAAPVCTPADALRGPTVGDLKRVEAAAPESPAPAPAPVKAGPLPLWFTGSGRRLADGDIAWAAAELGCDPAAILAVVDVETDGCGFDAQRRPDALFEAHHFHRHTGGRYAGAVDRRGKLLSSRKWDRTLYGKTSHQWERVEDAAALGRRDGREAETREAAWKSCSLGLFQVLGSEFDEAGYDSVEAFVHAMCQDERAHLTAFVALVKHRGLDKALRARDWHTFAERYNGASQEVHDYEGRLARAYAKRKAAR